MEDIYIILTKTNTLLSRLIAKVTKDPFTHVSISLNRELTEVYSFGRIIKNNPFRGGFVKENLHGGIYEDNQDSKCAIYALEISHEEFIKIKESIEKMSCKREDYKYNFLGLFNFIFPINIKRKNKYFCSEFVSKLLVECGALNMPTSPSKTKPSDFMKHEKTELVYLGELFSAI